MTDALKNHVGQAAEQMKKVIAHLEAELLKIRAGKASPQVVEGLMVDYYGNPTPLSQISNINTPDGRTIAIQPWEKNMIDPIEKAIMDANLGFTPQNDGTLIRINIPPLTEERRKDLVKGTHAEGEHNKVSIRNIRRDSNEHIKKETKNGASEDMVKEAELEVQSLTDAHIKKIDEHVSVKEKEIMTV
ncbi:MAG: ribosome recycling factor [Bacteroidia bacterium]|nr:ribosome recycling factor [Bacteroidia bacterium]NNC85769.1 ribosome recycling factor [Bacteroidia bacterium]NNM15707.1 ribosome recycling factor [Bacteroidia bacterium]